jgi:proline iminopeptidase
MNAVMTPVLVLAMTALPVLPTAAESATPEAGKLFTSPAVTLYYEVRGSGSATPLVVLNGGPGFDHAYLHVSSAWDALARSRPVLFYDQRGNGRSAPLKPGQSCTLADQIADLDALLDHVGYARVHLLGHSWGGYLAMAYAARHPARVARLVIVDSAAPKWDDTVFLFKDIFPEGTERQQAAAFAEALGDKAAVETGIREYLSMLFYAPEKREAFLAQASAFVYKPEINQTLNTDLHRFDLGPELPKFRFPTLVVTGRYDINVAPSVAYKIHRAIPGSRFLVFEKSGHLPFFEESDGFASALEEFLAGRSRE